MSRTVLSSEGPLAAAITRVSSCTVPACCSAFMWSTEKGPCIHNQTCKLSPDSKLCRSRLLPIDWRNILED